MADGQKHVNKPTSDTDETTDQAVPAKSESAQKASDEADGVLDEIDDVLEENAEDFVRGFVQKGGQ